MSTLFIPYFLSETMSVAKGVVRADDAPFVALRLRLWLLRFVKIPNVRQIAEMLIGSPKHGVVPLCRCDVAIDAIN